MTEAPPRGLVPAENSGPLTWSVVTDRAEVAGLEADWRRLTGPRGFFVGPDWVLAWLRFRGGAEASPHVLLARDSAGAVAGVLPLVVTGRGDLEPAGRLDGVAHVDVLAAPGRETEVAEGALARLAAHKGGRVRLARLSEDGALAGAIRARAADLSVLVRPVTVCPYASLPAGWEGFLFAIDKHYRHDARRQVRRFFERPDSEVRWAEKPAQVESALAALFDLHGRRFESLRRTSDFLGPGRREFHAALATTLAARGDLALGTLLLGGRPVSSAYGFRAAGTTCLFNTGIHPEFLETGGGFVLRALYVERAASFGPSSEIDFLDGCYEWKIRWASGVRVLVDADLFPSTALGHGGRFLAGALRRARSRAADLVKGSGRCPGRPTNASESHPDRCRRVGCRFTGTESGENPTTSPAEPPSWRVSGGWGAGEGHGLPNSVRASAAADQSA